MFRVFMVFGVFEVFEVSVIWEGQKGDKGGGPKMAKIQYGVKPDSFKYALSGSSRITNFHCIPKKKVSNTPKFHGKTPPHLRDPQLLALTFSGLLFLLLVLLLRLAAAAAFAAACACCCFWAADRRTPLSSRTFAVTFHNVNHNFLQLIGTPLTSTNCNKIWWYPTEFPRKTLLLSPPPFGAPHLLALIFLGLVPCIRASLLLLLCEKHTLRF